ncbi:LuxR C-terminal-related transcriptional regulator [Paenibacillus allorhizosphaerae]|uniref:HTH-type transcriptional regulator MalT n=1 Tax=Paenibacillus allorhizosphaerae TaxID=2849866 RepID=A0ABN7TH79_9BACL|nr:LuxR C-terminal-related transcriptional regulator [Paenibacillus allorhizosphaerae]CAG7628782.1 HTH-type transcriptional regulator MalT [Paenibacillus allorhizosphaerae]
MLQPFDAVMLQTKTKPPAPPGNEVERSHILHVLPTVTDRTRLVSVCAPAGSGKTTLLNQWARRESAHLAWVSLDAKDNDPSRFWRYVIQALGMGVPPMETSNVVSLVQSFPNVSLHTVIDALINELAAAAEPTIVLLDDYHVIHDPVIHDTLSYFIDYLPDHVCIAITSRTELPFPATKWNARGERAEVTALQLRFNKEEAVRFYREVALIPLTGDQVGKLMKSTEGWVAGLQLLGIVLQHHRNIDAFLERFAGHHPMLSDYLFQEVFGGLDSELRDFLLETSVLQRMDAELCDAFTGRSDSAELLVRVKRLNLFVIPLDDFGQWYRYHHLFTEFLQNELKRGGKARWLQLHEAAARRFAERELLDEATDHAIAAENYRLAEHLLELNIVSVLQRGEFTTLLRWFGALPEPERLSPQLQLLHAFLLAVTGQFDQAEAKLNFLERLAESATEGEKGQIRSGLFFVRANLAFTSGRYEDWYEYADRIPEMLPESPVFYNFNYNRTEPLVRRTDFAFKGALPPGVEAIAFRFTAMLESRGWHDSLITQYVLQSLAEGYYEWSRLAECETLLSRTEKVGRSRRIPGLFVPCRIIYAKVRLVASDAKLARELIEEAAETVRSWGEYAWSVPLQAFLARIDAMEGAVGHAEERLRLLHLHPGDKPTFDRAFEYTVLARLLLQTGREAEAQRLLELLRPLSVRERCVSDVAEIAVLQALLEQQLGNRAGALQHLDEALAIGEANGFLRLFLDEGEKLAELLQHYVRQRFGGYASSGKVWSASVTADYVRRLIEQFPDVLPVSSAASLVEPLTRSEMNLLERLRQGDSNKQAAKELYLTEGTVKVYLSRIYGKLGVSSRTQAILKAQELELFE